MACIYFVLTLHLTLTLHIDRIAAVVKPGCSNARQSFSRPRGSGRSAGL